MPFAATHAPLAGHLWHLLLLAVWLPIFGVIVAVEKVRTTNRTGHLLHARPVVLIGAAPGVGGGGDPSRSVTWCQAMATGSVSAALIHMAVMPGHFQQSVWYGSFFLGAALSQLAFAVVILVRPSYRLLVAGVAGSATIVVLWLATRVVGVPIGPDNGATEPFGLLDVVASVAELGAVIAGLCALRVWRAIPGWRWSHWSTVMRVLGPASLTAAVAVSVFGSRS